MNDPETEVGCAPLADVPCLPELPRLIRLKYLTAVNRWTRLEAPVALLRPRRDDSLVWQDMLADYGVDDVARVPGPVRMLGLSRVVAHRPGDGVHRRGCGLPYRHRRAGDRRPPPVPGPHVRRRPGAPGTDRAGRAHAVLGARGPAQTPETDRYLRALVPPDAERRPVPSGACNVAAQLLAVEAGVDDHPPWARVHMAGEAWLTLRAARLGDPPSDIAVTIETASPAERTEVFAGTLGLSPREVELLGHLVAGAATRHIAECISEHTVQDHLKSIFAESGTHNRRTLIARAAGR